MKTIAFALTLILCLIGVVDSKLNYELSRRDHHDELQFSEFDNVPLSDPGRDSDEYEKREYHNNRYDTDVYTSTRECGISMNSCAIPLMSKYNKRDDWAPIAIPLKVRLAGARAICRDGMKFVRCVKSKSNQPVCQLGLSEYSKSLIEDSWSLGQKLCVDRIDDLAKHWNCILSLGAINTLIKCDPGRAPYNRYFDINETIDCVVDGYGSIPDCEAGATDFIREILPGVMNMNFKFHLMQYTGIPVDPF